MKREDFLKSAPLDGQIGGSKFTLRPREFKGGSLGWAHVTKGEVIVGNKLFNVQVNLLLTVIGSK